MKKNIKNTLLIGFLVALFLFCSFNSCSSREGFFGGFVLEQAGKSFTGGIQSIVSSAVGGVNGVQKAVENGYKQGITGGVVRENYDADMVI